MGQAAKGLFRGFRLVSFGDILGHPSKAMDVAGYIADGEGAVADPANRVIGPDDAVVGGPFAGGDLFLERGGHALLVVGVYERGPETGFVIEDVWFGPPDRFEGRADIDKMGLGPVDEVEHLVNA